MKRAEALNAPDRETMIWDPKILENITEEEGEIQDISYRSSYQVMGFDT